MKLAARLDRVKPSATLAAKEAAATLRAQGVMVVDFGPGEPDFPTPPHVVAAAKEALDRGETHYSAGAGLPSLRQALARKLGERSGARLEPNQFIVTCGGKSALLYLMLALVQEGDEVVVPAPCWVTFPEQVLLAGATPVVVPPPGGDQRLRIDALAAAITSRTRVVIVNSPANPSGAIMAAEDWQALAALISGRDLTLISDETYLDFAYSPTRPAISALALAAQLGEKLAVVNSFSKAHAMTGWRVGYAWGHPKLITALNTLQSQDTTHPATFAQWGALAALEGPSAPLQEMQAEYASRRRLILEALDGVPGWTVNPPDGAFYLFPEVSVAMQQVGCADDREFALRLLREAHVSVVAGSAFHAPGHVRLTYAVSRQDIIEGIRRIRWWMESGGKAGSA